MTAPRILIVDHDSAHADHCRTFLAPQGYEVLHAASVIEARRHVALGVAAAIIDGIPSDRGIGDLIERLRGQDVPLFGMTDVYLGDTNRAIALMLDEYVEYWSKPLPAHDVVPWLNRTIGGEDMGRQTADLRAVPQSAQPVHEPRSAFTFSREVEALASNVGESSAPRRRDPSVEVLSGPQGIPDAGEFSEYSFAEVLGAMAAKQATGSLMLRNGKVKKLVYLERGVPVGAKSNLERERLGQMMRTHRLISADQLKASRQAMQREGVLQGEALIATGVLDRVNLQELLDIQLRVKMEDVFRWSEGAYTFRRTNIPPNYNTATGVTTLQLIRDASRYLIPEERIQELVQGARGRRLMWFRVLDQVAELHLSRTERMLIDHITQRGELDTLEATVADATEIRQLLFTLMTTGFVGLE